MTRVRSIALLVSGLLALATFLPSAFASGTAARVEIPITQVTLSGGNIRYAVPVRIGGGHTIMAMLDTGSVGLRVMAGALASSHYEDTGIVRTYHFDGGVAFQGPLVNATLAIGNATMPAPVTIQSIQTVMCSENQPNCPAARINPSDYGIGGNGVPREGFQAILGLSLRKPPFPVAAFNPLGNQNNWTIILPLPGGTMSGTLIVNPSQTELAGFQMIPLPSRQFGSEGGFDSGPGGIAASANKFPICLDNRAPQGTCPPIKLDSGARDGLEPFYAYAILFDQAQGMIGVKSRRDMPRQNTIGSR